MERARQCEQRAIIRPIQANNIIIIALSSLYLPRHAFAFSLLFYKLRRRPPSLACLLLAAPCLCHCLLVLIFFSSAFACAGRRRPLPRSPTARRPLLPPPPCLLPPPAARPNALRCLPPPSQSPPVRPPGSQAQYSPQPVSVKAFLREKKF